MSIGKSCVFTQKSETAFRSISGRREIMKTRKKKWLLLLITLLVFTAVSSFPAFAAKPVLLAKATVKDCNTAKITWKKLSGASRYVVYYSKCGTDLSTKSKSVTKKGSKSSCMLEGLDANDAYKFVVHAQKKVSGEYKTFAVSLMGHFITGVYGNNTNPKSIQIAPPSMKIGAGSTVELGATIKKISYGKSFLNHEPPVRYVSSNPAVAKVDADGVVKAVKKGSCKIYAVAINGAWSTANVFVTPNNAKTKIVKKTVTKKTDTYKVTYQYLGTVPKGAPAVPKAASYKVGKSVPSAAVPSLKGYQFSGWKGEVSKMPEKNVLVTGSWTGNEHKITYKYTGTVPKNAPAVPAVSTRRYGDKVTKAYTPALAGYTFSGWKGEVSTMPDKDVTVTGSWTKKKYKVTYQFAGDVPSKAKVPAAATYAYGDAVKDPSVSAVEGYEFKGWTGSVKTMPDHDVTVIGVWKVKEYTLSYKYEKYSGIAELPDDFSFPAPPRSVKVKFGEELPLVSVPQCRGFQFDKEWTLNGKAVPKTMPARDLTVSGSWHKEFIVRYEIYQSEEPEYFYNVFDERGVFARPLGRKERIFLEGQEVDMADFLLLDEDEAQMLHGQEEVDLYDVFKHQGERFFLGGFNGIDYSQQNLAPNWCGEALEETYCFLDGFLEGWQPSEMDDPPTFSSDGNSIIIDRDFYLRGCLCTPMPDIK